MVEVVTEFIMSEYIDHYGFNVSTSNPDAAKAFTEGSRSFVAWRADAMVYLNNAIELDPSFALPKILKAWILHGGRTAKYDPVIDGLLLNIVDNIEHTNTREHAMMTALSAAHNGNPQTGAAILEDYLTSNPMDLIAHRLLQFELFWCGESRWMRDIAERAAPAWSDKSPDYSHFLAVRAFSNEEAGDYVTAEDAGRGAVERDPESAWGAHAVAHVLVMQGRIDEGRIWMENLSGNWGKANQIGHHCWWHLCLFLLETGEHERIIELLHTQIRNPESPLVQAVPDATIDIQNVASMLKRLELRGVDVGDNWEVIADISAQRVTDHANPFSSAHDAMALAAIGDFDSIDALVKSMHNKREENSTLGHTTAAFGIPLVKAMASHKACDYENVIDLLWPIRRNLYQVGGSHAQRDIFYQVLVDSAMRANKPTQLAALLEDISGIGFERVGERTLYRDAFSLAA